MKGLSKEELLEWFDKQMLDPVHKCVWGTERDRQAYQQIRQLIENQPKNIKAEELARTFHEEYEKLASRFNYETRKETKGDWENLPNNNKQLMIAVAEAVMDKYFKGQIAKKRMRNE